MSGPIPKSKLQVWIELLLESKEEGECLLITSGHNVGIGYKRRRAGGYDWYVHQISDQMINGPLPPGTVLRHTCDRPNCINPKHLLRGTHTDNAIDRYRKGRTSRGVAHYRAKLTEEQVREIRQSNKSYTALSRIYGISRGGIYNIINGQVWRNVT